MGAGTGPPKAGAACGGAPYACGAPYAGPGGGCIGAIGCDGIGCGAIGCGAAWETGDRSGMVAAVFCPTSVTRTICTVMLSWPPRSLAICTSIEHACETGPDASA